MSEQSEHPPITLSKQPAWQPKQLVVFDALNSADLMVNLHVVFFGGGREVMVHVGIFPHWPTRVVLPLETASGATLFMKRTPGRFKATVHGGNLAFADLEGVRIDVPEAARELVTLSNAHIADTAPSDFPMPEKPVVDDLHQWTGREWPGKAASIDDVRAALTAEMSAVSPLYPEGWSKYGGWKAKRLSSTGWFRAENDGRRWWLVDPDGFAFWSMGPDCVRIDAHANVDGIESAYATPLPDAAQAPHLWSQRKGEKLFNGLAHNLERALGDKWYEQWQELTRRRLVAYRFNTIANWSDPKAYQFCRIPYVFTMAGFPSTRMCIFRDFPDVFSPEYEANCRAFAHQLGHVAEDEYMIGYFMTNEPQWAFLADFDLGVQLMRDDRKSSSRDAFIAFLKDKYQTVAALNAAWGASFQTLEDLRKRQDLAALPQSKADTQAFTAEAVERYVRLPAKTCKQADPHHMNLGLRWAWIHSDYQLAGHKYLDAFSINCYQLKPDAAQIEQLTSKTGKPILIGEFHIGALDRGLPSGGIRNTATMAESAKAYRYYMENAAAIPGLVGAHYFQWNDQPVLGRFDGENMQIGFCDTTGRMYPELAASATLTHQEVYRVAAGEKAPFAEEPVTVPQGTLVW
jgi:hypothetical protein